MQIVKQHATYHGYFYLNGFHQGQVTASEHPGLTLPRQIVQISIILKGIDLIDNCAKERFVEGFLEGYDDANR